MNYVFAEFEYHFSLPTPHILHIAIGPRPNRYPFHCVTTNDNMKNCLYIRMSHPAHRNCTLHSNYLTSTSSLLLNSVLHKVLFPIPLSHKHVCATVCRCNMYCSETITPTFRRPVTTPEFGKLQYTGQYQRPDHTLHYIH